MADNMAPPDQGAKREQHDFHNEATQQGPQAASQQPLRPAMVMGLKSDAAGRKDSDSMSTKSGASKVVSIAEEPESIPSLSQPADTVLPHKHQFSAGMGKRLTGRPTSTHSSSKVSLKSQTSFEDLPAAALQRLTEASASQRSHPQSHRHGKHQHQKLLHQVGEWLQVQKGKSATRTANRANKGPRRAAAGADGSTDHFPDDSDAGAISLGDLEKILEANMNLDDSKRTPTGSPKLGPRKPSYGPRRPSLTSRSRPSSRRMSKAYASSDTEFFDGDVLVPSCDVVLDNTKTLSYAGGAAASEMSLPAQGQRADKEAKAWATFKSEILRLAHTLRLKGWRRVPLENGADIEVERLSGALTNAVYVVSPPSIFSEPKEDERKKKKPAKLLLRIYGPQVEHLIDREAELAILRRLARKKIGPRLLGTFKNGRFEEYFASTTLTWDDLRVPETSKQIAKRMRELHDGIDLLEKERDDGPFVFRNWDKWVDRCEHVIKFLDNQILCEGHATGDDKAASWKKKGYVCGVEWKTFRKMVENYRKWLYEKYDGADGLRNKLFFAHNDTQYGNILRLLPATESPLLQPANSHKQLVVIDFEYASANTPGLEFANHFTEWCYNYHDPVKPHACNTKFYPTPEEQRRFIHAYLNHRPQYVASASATPKARPSAGPGSLSGQDLSAFMLDARTPAGSSNYQEEEQKREEALEKKIEQLIFETRLWRVANSAQWVAWGIVQANVPELDEMDEAEKNASASSDSTVVQTPAESPRGGHAEPKWEDKEGGIDVVVSGKELQAEETAEEDEEEFDYLAYAQDRAMFFWGDCVDLGLVRKEELPEGVRDRIKIIGY